MPEAPDPHLQDKAYVLIWLRGLKEPDLERLIAPVGETAYNASVLLQPPARAMDGLINIAATYGKAACGTWLAVYAAWVKHQHEKREAALEQKAEDIRLSVRKYRKQAPSPEPV